MNKFEGERDWSDEGEIGRKATVSAPSPES